jgi:hypothetical protein
MAGKETLATLKGKLIQYRAETEADFKIIDGKLDQIITHLKETNGTIKEHEARLLNQEVNKATNCPFREKIDELVIDDMTKKKVNKLVLKSVTIAVTILGGIVSAIYIVDRFIL